MKKLIAQSKNLYASVFTLLLVFGFTFSSEAHCDRVNGPVAVAAKKALQTGDSAHALIWVTDQQADELKSIFEQSLEVYAQGGDSQALAERYFMENTVRLHRQAEGMPYTGLKPAQPNPEDIQAAEEALESDDVAEVTDLLTQEIRHKISELHANAIAAKDNKGQSVEAGRKWVDAYVQYVVFIHGLYQNIQAGPAHGVGE